MNLDNKPWNSSLQTHSPTLTTCLFPYIINENIIRIIREKQCTSIKWILLWCAYKWRGIQDEGG